MLRPGPAYSCLAACIRLSRFVSLLPCTVDIWAGRVTAAQRAQPGRWSTAAPRTDCLACSTPQPSPPEQQETTAFRWACADLHSNSHVNNFNFTSLWNRIHVLERIGWGYVFGSRWFGFGRNGIRHPVNVVLNRALQNIRLLHVGLLWTSKEEMEKDVLWQYIPGEIYS